MTDRQDPITRAADGQRDLQGITTWEPRSLPDRLLARYVWLVIRLAIVGLATLVFGGVLVLLAVQMVFAPEALLAVFLFPLSVVPALIIVGYVWYTDVSREPILLLLATFLLGVVLSAFPFVTNTATLLLVGGFFEVPVIGFFLQAAFFFLIVAPMEELVTLGAVFAYVYWHDSFDTVIDGAVYGAAAGLGFATIENFAYIVQVLAGAEGMLELVVGAGVITGIRGIVGPGHVIWTALAGYYLGLAKFNPEYRLALVTKGLLIAIVLHATYNTMATGIGRAGAAVGLELLVFPVLVAFIVCYHGIVLGYLLLRLSRYRRAYMEVGLEDRSRGQPDRPADGP